MKQFTLALLLLFTVASTRQTTIQRHRIYTYATLQYYQGHSSGLRGPLHLLTTSDIDNFFEKDGTFGGRR
jgi:hypothetical protein